MNCAEIFLEPTIFKQAECFFLFVYRLVKKLEYKVQLVQMRTCKHNRRLIVGFVQIYEIRFVIKK